MGWFDNFIDFLDDVVDDVITEIGSLLEELVQEVIDSMTGWLQSIFQLIHPGDTIALRSGYKGKAIDIEELNKQLHQRGMQARRLDPSQAMQRALAAANAKSEHTVPLTAAEKRELEDKLGTEYQAFEVVQEG